MSTDARALALLDRYLLAEPISKTEVIDALLAAPSSEEVAAPFYRALRAVGPRVADEALMALRVALQGSQPEDRIIVALRTIRAQAGQGDVTGARAAYEALLKRT